MILYVVDVFVSTIDVAAPVTVTKDVTDNSTADCDA
jgi:hypothetical protein